jgi:hypothetical protein
LGLTHAKKPIWWVVHVAEPHTDAFLRHTDQILAFTCERHHCAEPCGWKRWLRIEALHLQAQDQADEFCLTTKPGLGKDPL